MIETRETSALTRFALAALTRLHQTDMEAMARAASLSDSTPLNDGWRLDVAQGVWTREVPDPAPPAEGE
jgi:hypothetical protein